MTHTPGPWHVYYDPADPDERPGIEADGVSIVVWGEWHNTTDDTGIFGRKDDREEGFANAHLISAAPDLLEALQLHIAYEATPTDRGGSQGPKGKAWKAFVEARDKAIAKATNA